MLKRKKLYAIGGKSRTGKGIISSKVRGLRGDIEILGTDDFRRGGDDVHAWRNIVSHLQRETFASDVLIEGVAINPQRVHGLTLNQFFLERALFLGYSRVSHADAILAYAKKVRHNDWVFRELEQNPEYEKQVRDDWMAAGIPESAQIKNEAERFGYAYFDVTDYPDFENYLEAVTAYLLKIG